MLLDYKNSLLYLFSQDFLFKYNWPNISYIKKINISNEIYTQKNII